MGQVEGPGQHVAALRAGENFVPGALLKIVLPDRKEEEGQGQWVARRAGAAMADLAPASNSCGRREGEKPANPQPQLLLCLTGRVMRQRRRVTRADTLHRL